VARRAANTDLYIPDRFESSGTSTVLDIRFEGSDILSGFVRDEAGTGPGGLDSLSLDLTQWAAWILTIDTSSDRVRGVGKNAAGARVEDKRSSAGFTSSLIVDRREFFSSQTGGVDPFDGDFRASGWAPTNLDDATQDQLIDDLARIHF
jgi:hypothetical protein